MSFAITAVWGRGNIRQRGNRRYGRFAEWQVTELDEGQSVSTLGLEKARSGHYVRVYVFSTHTIVTLLRQIEVLMAQGAPRQTPNRSHRGAAPGQADYFL